jgi:hypothetical protein
MRNRNHFSQEPSQKRTNIDNENKKDQNNTKKIDYIIRSDKPLIFRKKKIKKVSDLIGKSNLNKKEEDDFNWENEDLSEKFFERYFALSQFDDKPKININRDGTTEIIK